MWGNARRSLFGSGPVDAGSPHPPRAVFVLHRLELRKGGLTKAWLARVRLFASAGWDVQLALISEDPQIEETLRHLRADGLLPPSAEVHLYRRERGGRGGPAIDRLLRRHHSVAGWLDIVASRDGAVVFGDSPSAYSLLAAMRNPRAARVFVIHLAHLSAEATRLATPQAIADGPLTKRFSVISDQTMRTADRIVVLTKAQQEDFRLRWGADLPVDVIPHCAKPADLPGDLPYDPRLVVVIGRLDYYKRWDTAIRTMARVVREVPDARLEIHGRGDDLDRLQSLVQELGLDESVTFAGYENRALETMAGAACVIATTRREGMPLTLLECLSVGTPVVVHDIRYGPAEIVRDGIDGFVVPVGDIRAASAAVVRLLAEPGLRQRMSRSAREVTARYSCQAHDRAWLSLGQELYDRRGVVPDAR